MAIIVKVWMDRMGNIFGEPVREDLQRKIARHMKAMTSHADKSFFLQEGMGAGEFMADCTPRQRRDIEHGYEVRMRMDPWVMGHLYGWDAHTIFE